MSGSLTDDLGVIFQLVYSLMSRNILSRYSCYNSVQDRDLLQRYAILIY